MARTIIIASRNLHKCDELRALLGPSWICRSLAEFPEAPAVEETASTFAGNATLKAVSFAQWLGAPGPAGASGTEGPIFVLADDSGLEVDALQGAPGVHSARFAAGAGKRNSADADNNAKLLKLLDGVPAERRTARFRCVLALIPLVPHSGEGRDVELFEGTCEGRIEFGGRGQGGFGYDPLFIPSGFEQSFGELSSADKNRISHRAQALQHLRAYLNRPGQD